MKTLQWGHAQKGVETEVLSAWHHHEFEASMGPRPERRGNLVYYEKLCFEGGMLQWGHAQKGVETALVQPIDFAQVLMGGSIGYGFKTTNGFHCLYSYHLTHLHSQKH